MSPQELTAYFDEIYALNLACLDLVPEEKLDFQPVPEVKSLRLLLHHMYVNQKFYLLTARKGTMDVDDYKAMMKQVPDTKESLRREMGETFAEFKQALGDEALLKKEVQTLSGSRRVYHLFIGELEHQLHHRGQVYTYLRLLGLKPPDSGLYMGLAS